MGDSSLHIQRNVSWENQNHGGKLGVRGCGEGDGEHKLLFQCFQIQKDHLTPRVSTMNTTFLSRNRSPIHGSNGSILTFKISNHRKGGTCISKVTKEQIEGFSHLFPVVE